MKLLTVPLLGVLVSFSLQVSAQEAGSKSNPHVLTGPIAVLGAEPGDVLEVRIQSVELAIPYGYNRIADPGFLSDEIFVRNVRAIRLDTEKMVANFAPGIEIPLRPFFGSRGVAPPREAGKISSAPPWIHAGNLDNKELIPGTTLFIPVHVSGANFHVGDGHAAQGYEPDLAPRRDSNPHNHDGNGPKPHGCDENRPPRNVALFDDRERSACHRCVSTHEHSGGFEHHPTCRWQKRRACDAAKIDFCFG